MKKTRIVRTAEVTVETEETTVIRDRGTGGAQERPLTEVPDSRLSKTAKGEAGEIRGKPLVNGKR